MWPEDDASSPECRDLVERLLVLDPKSRLGHRCGAAGACLLLVARASAWVCLTGGGMLACQLHCTAWLPGCHLGGTSLIDIAPACAAATS